DDYSNALRLARAESDSLQGKLKKGMQDQQNAISHAETLSAEIVALKERTAAADRISHARLEALAAEKEKTQGVIHEAAQLAKKLKENEAELRLSEQRLSNMKDQLAWVRERSEGDRALNSRLRKQLATALSERVATANRIEKLGAELDAST